MPRPFEDRVALVTGASSDIGRVTALAFARQGAAVVVSARRVHEGEETVAMIKAQSGEARFAEAGITHAGEVEALLGTTIQMYGRLDYAFNNAGALGGFGTATADFDEAVCASRRQAPRICSIRAAYGVS